MFFNRKKIRLVNQLLDSVKKPADLQEVVRAVEQTSPTTVRPAFQKKLREQLMRKYPAVAATQSNSKKETRVSSRKPFFAMGPQKIWGVAFAVFILLIVGGVAGYPLIPAPEVQGYTLKNGVRKIAYNAPIQIVFSQMMDHSSVEKAFTIDPKIDGTTEWKGNTFIFKPQNTFNIGDSFKVSVSKNAKSFLQKPLNSEYEENYVIVAAPQISLFSPATESTDVPVDAKLTVHFDRPMVSLTSLDQGLQKPVALKIEPPVDFKTKWLGTSSMVFTPTKLAYATHYTVTIPQGTPSAEGGATDKDFTYTFDTLKPAFESSNIGDLNPYNGPDTIIKLNFNQPMNVQKAGDFVKLYRYVGTQNIVKNIDWNGKIFPADQTPQVPNSPLQKRLNTNDIAAQFTPSEWQETPVTFHYYTAAEYKKDYIADGSNYSGDASQFETQQIDIPADAELQKTLLMTPVSPLNEDSIYFIKIAKNFGGAEGTTFTLDDDADIVFKTAGPLQVVSINPVNNAPDVHDHQVIIEFNQQMESGTFKDKVIIEPKAFDDEKKEIKPTLSDEGSGSLFINYPFLPSTKYTVTVKQGAQSTYYNKVLDKDIVTTFTTAQLEPAFHLVSSPDISVLDANKPRVYYAKSTNVDTLHVQFKKLSQPEFDKMYSAGYIEDRNKPADGFQDFDVKVSKVFNKNVTTALDLEKITRQSLPSGYYYFEVTSPQVVNENYTPPRPQIDRQLFVVTGNGLATKLSKNQLLVWATSLKDGAPVAGMSIEATSRDGSKYTSTTDNDGLATITLSAKNDDYSSLAYSVLGRIGDDMTLTHTSWSDGVGAWNFNIDSATNPEKYFVYQYTDRPIYRPGDTVYFKGLVRVNNDMKYALPDLGKVKVTVNDSVGKEVMKKEFLINSNGTFNGELALGSEAATGDYQIRTSLAQEGDPEYAHSFYQNFQVAAYRKPDYKMTLTADKDAYVNGDTAKVTVNGQFFFGAPLPDAPVEWTVKGMDYYFFMPSVSKNPFAAQWFSFSDEGYLCYWGCTGETKVVSQGKGKLDSNGNFTIQLPLDIKSKKVSQFYTVEATAFDLNHQSVSSYVTLPVHQGEFYTGITSKESVSTKGKETAFDIITVDKDGNPVTGKTIDVSLLQREWNTIGKKNVDGDFYNENNFIDTLKEKKTVTTDGQGHATVSFVPGAGGSYKVKTETHDSRGNTISSATEIYVTSSDFVNWGIENNDRIELVPDKQEYKIGDTAHVLVKSPYQNVYALVTHERQDVVYKKVIKILSNSSTIDVPITERSLPNEFVSVLLVKGDNTAAGLPDPGKELDERNVAAFKLGYTTLQVNTSSRKLGIQVTSDQAKYHPGDQVTLNVHTVDANGKPVKAEVSLGVVDKSVLSLTSNVTADLLSEFYRKRYLGVETSDTLTKALSRLNVQVESGLKGGGGGGVAKRGLFKDTAFWQAVVTTDANGNGTAQFKLPDNLTTWQVMAIGITNDTLVGSQKVDFLVTKDVLARPVLPRFFIVNDSMTVGTVVHNYLDKGIDLDVALKANGLKINGNTTQRIHLEPGKEQRVDFSVGVLDQPEATVTFEAIKSDDKNVGDIVENKLPIHPYSFPEVVATSGEISDNTKHIEKVWLPIGIDPKFGELKISAASTLANTITEGIAYLVQFPYGCAEQTASSLLPNLAVKEIAQLPGLGVDKIIDEKQLQKNVQTGLQSLYKYQQSNGGWGLWENSEATPYLSSYVLYTLYEAQKAGYSVDQNVMKRGVDYIKNSIKNLPLSKDNRSNANNRSFALYVLAEMNQGDLALSNNLYDFKSQLNIFGKAYLAMAFHDLQVTLTGENKDDVQKKIDTLKGDILVLGKETPRGVHYEESQHEYTMFDTDSRTTALVLQMLSRVDSTNVMIPKILRNMLMEKKDGHFQTTQETAVSLLALADYLKASKELNPNYNGVITVNNVTKLDKNFSQKNLADVQSVTIPLTDLLPNNQDNEIAAGRDGAGKMYFDMNLRYFLPTEQIESRDEGIFVIQEYFKMEDKKQENPIETAKVGNNLIGKMTIIVPDDRHYVMVEDFLPSGLEGVDFSLQTAQQSLQDQASESGNDSPCSSWDCWEEMWRFNHSEVRDDRMMFFADFLPKGVYELKYVVRATSVGTFHDLPALAQETYFPEVFGRSAGRMFLVTN